MGHLLPYAGTYPQHAAGTLLLLPENRMRKSKQTAVGRQGSGQAGGRAGKQ